MAAWASHELAPNGSRALLLTVQAGTPMKLAAWRTFALQVWTRAKFTGAGAQLHP